MLACPSVLTSARLLFTIPKRLSLDWDVFILFQLPNRAFQTSKVQLTMVKRKHSEDLSELRHPSVKRALEIDGSSPYESLLEALIKQDEIKKVTGVAHWFRSEDLRIHDNKALYAAASLAKDNGLPLVTFYLDCPAELEWHGTSPARCDFMISNLQIMQDELKKLNIPLVFLQSANRKSIVKTVENFVKDNALSHIFANFEYEVDELRRDIQFIKTLDNKASFRVLHDQTIMEPGKLVTGTGKPMKIFTPYHSKWLAEVKAAPEMLDTVPPPALVKETLSKQVSSLFNSMDLVPPKNKEFSSSAERKRIRELWPAGHAAGMTRMKKFIQTNLEDYAETRSNPGKDSTSRMSAYFSAGVVSMREVVALVKDHNGNSSDFSSSGSSSGVYSWIREIVFRELYRQTTSYTPHTVMNLPNNLKFNYVNWEKDDEGYEKWCQGMTGAPLVDAGMRQLKHEAWMHNRARMNVSSYLYCNLLIDYRRGERFFANNLIDWDLSNNTQGWEPSYTVFNHVSQAERNDPEGKYIKKWLPELRGLTGKAVFDPHSRLSKADFEKLGYPAPHVDWKETKARATERFKNDMGGVTL